MVPWWAIWARLPAWLLSNSSLAKILSRPARSPAQSGSEFPPPHQRLTPPHVESARGWSIWSPLVFSKARPLRSDSKRDFRASSLKNPITRFWYVLMILGTPELPIHWSCFNVFHQNPQRFQRLQLLKWPPRDWRRGRHQSPRQQYEETSFELQKPLTADPTTPPRPVGGRLNQEHH